MQFVVAVCLIQFSRQTGTEIKPIAAINFNQAQTCRLIRHFNFSLLQLQLPNASYSSFTVLVRY